MNLLKACSVILMLVVPTLTMAQVVNLTHPSTNAESDAKHEIYDLLNFWVSGTGYVKFYGETYNQGFDHPLFADGDYNTPIKNFFATQLGFDQQLFDDGFAHFSKDNDEYYLKLTPSAKGYKYTLLKVVPCPETITLPVEGDYLKTDDLVEIPRHELIPNAEGFQISKATYQNYDEIKFYYDRKYNVHQGKYWKLSFSREAKDKNNFRYILAHDLKAKLLKMGGKILDDEDNKFRFRLGETIGSFSSYSSTFSLELIQEEAFQQSLLLTPDKIKTELDKTGKITLDGIYFDFNKATLKPESRAAILATVALMERYEDLVLAVFGHTDSKGDDDYNLKLSGERAAAVLAGLVGEGVGTSRLQSRGFGEEEPVASNETEEGRAENRRVELHKISGGDSRSVITIDFIKPMENSVVSSRYNQQSGTLGVNYRQPHSDKQDYVEFDGLIEIISYEIKKNGQIDSSVSRREIIKNYENILVLYNAKVLGIYSHNLYFEITDRGDGQRVFGVVEGYDGKYTISFLVQEK